MGQWDLFGAEAVKPLSKACDERGVHVLPPELMAKLPTGEHVILKEEVLIALIV